MGNIAWGIIAVLIELIIIRYLYLQIKSQEENKEKSDLDRRMEEEMRGFRVLRMMRNRRKR